MARCRPLPRSLAAVLAVFLLECGPPRSPAGVPLEPEPVPTEFQERVAAYVAVREGAAATVPPLRDTSDPALLRKRQQALATAIKKARPQPHQGDVFCDAVVPYFRRVVKSDMKERDTDAALEEVPQVSFKIHDAYPEQAPLATVPAMLLARMPRLPSVLEYRFVARHLILLDVEANLIVDYLPGLLRQPAS